MILPPMLSREFRRFRASLQERSRHLGVVSCPLWFLRTLARNLTEALEETMTVLSH